MTDWPPELVAKIARKLDHVYDPEGDALRVLDAIRDDVVLKSEMREELDMDMARYQCRMPRLRRYVTDWEPATSGDDSAAGPSACTTDA